MCLGTFSRLARSLATIYIFARVCIFGTSVPFYVTGNSSEFPVTSKIGFAYSTPLPLNLEGIRGFFFLKYTS